MCGGEGTIRRSCGTASIAGAVMVSIGGGVAIAVCDSMVEVPTNSADAAGVVPPVQRVDQFQPVPW